MIRLKSFISKFNNNRQENIQIINYWALLLFVFWLPLHDNFLPLILTFWVITWLFEGNFKTRFIDFPNKLIYISIIIFFGLSLLALTRSKDIENGFFDVQVKLSMLFFPLIIAGSNQKIKQNSNEILYTFVLGNIVAIVYCFSHAFFSNLVIEGNDYYIRYWAEEGLKQKSFWTLVSIRLNLFSYSYLSILKHPAYFSMYLSLSICIIYHFIREKVFKQLKYKIVAYLLILFFCFTIYILQSRSGIIALAGIIVMIYIIEIRKKLNKRFFLIFTPIFLIIVSLFLSSPLVRNNLNNLKEISQNPNNFSLIKSDIRIQLWYTSILVIKENFWYGTSPADLKENLTKKYHLFGLKEAEKERLNSHNQYLESFAGLGIYGFIALLFIIFYSLVYAIKKHHFLLFLLVILISINFMFESMLNRMAGVLFIMFFLSLFLFVNNQLVKKNR